MAAQSSLKAGVMGWPITHSLSPRLHGFWLRAHGLDGSYTALPVKPDELRDALRALPQNGFRGVNLTVPLKEAACAIVDDMDDTARRIGAINLVTVGTDGKLFGRNTDAFGFAQNLLSSGFSPHRRAACVLGAGGAARAVLTALADMGYRELFLCNRTPERAASLARELTTQHCSITPLPWADATSVFPRCDLLVNATSAGMKGANDLDIDLSALPADATVTDIVYTPLETGLLRRARQRGLKTVDGLGMLLHQARPSFAAFFGPDPAVTAELRAFVLEGLS